VVTVLDHPVWESLHGAHRSFGVFHGRVAAYQPDVSPFCGVSPTLDARTWADLAGFATPGTPLYIPGLAADPPSGWEILPPVAVVQMVLSGAIPDPARSAGSDPITVLTPADVPEMLDLVRRTGPGPFSSRTIEVGRYLGIRRDGKLIAMAGERMRPPGFCEVSAVCTDPAYRGQGLAARLIRTVAAGIRARAETPFLHVKADNTAAIALYGTLGFRARREMRFAALLVKTRAGRGNASVSRSREPSPDHAGPAAAGHAG
jgi:ribosomal protein S18 acetylase RimI-like enzyme